MSTSIYTGFTFTNPDLAHALQLMGAQKAAIQDLANEKTIAWVVNRAVEFVDTVMLHRADGVNGFKAPAKIRSTLAGEDNENLLDDTPVKKGWGDAPLLEDTFCAVTKAYYQLRDRQKRCRGSDIRDPGIDCDVTAALYFDPKSKRLLGRVFEERVGAYKHLTAVPGIEEFGFWNNTDHPEGMTRAAWERREKVWDAVYKNPQMLCLEVKWKPDWMPDQNSDPQMEPHFPTLERRAFAYARDQVQDEYVNQNWKPSAPGDLSGIHECMMNLRDELDNADSPWAKRMVEITEIYAGALFNDDEMREAVKVPLKQLAQEGRDAMETPQKKAGLRP